VIFLGWHKCSDFTTCALTLLTGRLEGHLAAFWPERSLHQSSPQIIFLETQPNLELSEERRLVKQNLKIVVAAMQQ